MVQATNPTTTQFLSVQAAAAELHSLINTNPTLPHVHEIEAIIAKVARGESPGRWDNVAGLRKEWLEHVLETEARTRAADVTPGCEPPEMATIEAAREAAYNKQIEFESEILDRPAHTFEDVRFLADVFVYQLWPGHTLTLGPLPHNKITDQDEMFDRGPHCAGAEPQLAALLRAIRDVPSSQQDGAPLLQNAKFTEFVRLRQALRDHVRKLAGEDATDAHQAQHDRLLAAMDAVVEQIWAEPPRTLDDVLIRGEIAFYHEDGVMAALHSSLHHFSERGMAQLIDAVLTVGRRALGRPDDGRRVHGVYDV